MRRTESLTWAGFTLILLGYLMVWLPNPAAGLALTGLELGEWIKFLPEVQSGAAGPRELFYVPPVTLGLMMVVVTCSWPNRRWQTWGMRGLGLAVSWLAFPAIEALRFEGISQWGLRVAGIGLVAAASGGAAWVSRRRPTSRLPRWLIMALALSGALLPLWLFFPIRDMVSNILGMPLGIGPGIWFHVLGHLLVVGGVWGSLWAERKGERAHQNQ